MVYLLFSQYTIIMCGNQTANSRHIWGFLNMVTKFYFWCFHSSYFERDPDAIKLFTHMGIHDFLNSDSFRAYIAWAMNTIDISINLLDNPGALRKHLNHLRDFFHQWEGVRKKAFLVQEKTRYFIIIFKLDWCSFRIIL